MHFSKKQFKLRGSLRKVTEGHGDDKLTNTPFPKVIKIIEEKKTY